MTMLGGYSKCVIKSYSCPDSDAIDIELGGGAGGFVQDPTFDTERTDLTVLNV